MSARPRPRSLIVLGFALLADGCGNDAGRSDPEAAKRAFLLTYADIARAGYSDAAAAAKALQQTIETFVAAPSAAGLASAREAWRAARVPYLQTEAFRFYEGPIDKLEGLINAWPIDEGFIETVSDGARPGILDDVEARPTLSAELLVSLNESEGETSIATGFHALEFLLWGPDRSEVGPGERSFKDYLPAKRPARRRGDYLRLAAGLLVEHLQVVAEAWSERAGGYRSSFLAQPPERSLALVLKGLGTLSGPELGGERLTVAYETKDQEHEHSCFSDSTDQDLILDAIGIRNVVLGRYERAGGALAGTGLRAVVAASHPALAARLVEAADNVVAAMRAIPAPFDQAILGKDSRPGRQAVKRAMAAARTQADLFAEVIATLGLPVTL